MHPFWQMTPRRSGVVPRYTHAARPVGNAEWDLTEGAGAYELRSMDLYHTWFDLKPGVSDVEFARSLDAYLGKLRADGRIAGYRLSRRKLGLGLPQLGEFHVVIEVEDLAQLDRAFIGVSERGNPLESLHAAVNQSVSGFQAALYRDFPDPHRKRGEERF